MPNHLLLDRPRAHQAPGAPADSLPADRLQAIRQRLEKGFYEQPAVVEAIASAIAREGGLKG
ncbi:MAG: hypothetical protein ABIQ49_11880 [Gemmatimonadales bacterium]